MARRGDSAVGIVEAIVRALEDSGLFNAGKGSVESDAQRVEMDASLMNGRTLKSGAVAGVLRFKNPFQLASLVIRTTENDFIVGSGIERLATENGIPPAEPGYFNAERAREAQADDPRHFGTVGVVARDRCGDLAAGTSTGGTMGKREGRVGDSPVIGAGTYADNSTAAISATGIGEYFIRLSAARSISLYLKHRQGNLRQAVDQTLRELRRLSRNEHVGGVIAIDSRGRIAIEPGMVAGGWITDSAGPTLR